MHHVRFLREVFNTDETKYGGSGKVRGEVRCHADQKTSLQLPPLATAIYEVEWQ